MDYSYPSSESVSLDPTLLKVLMSMQKSIDEAIERLTKIEQHLEGKK
jgi:hypothetical protein